MIFKKQDGCIFAVGGQKQKYQTVLELTEGELE